MPITSSNAQPTCGICALHTDEETIKQLEIGRSELWVLRHHPQPAPLTGWLILDSLRHCSGPIDFNTQEAAQWGSTVQQCSRMVKQLTHCDRIYAIAFGEGAQHLHLHLIPRCKSDQTTTAWAVADLYRAVAAGHHSPASTNDIQTFVKEARSLWKKIR